MTVISTRQQTTRNAGRSNGLGVHSVDHFALQIPNLSEADDFYKTFGLNVAETGARLDISCDGDAHNWGYITEGATKRLHHMSFNCFAEDVQPLKLRIEKFGVKLLDPPPGFDSDGIWFHDCDGQLLEIKVGPKTSPDQKMNATFESSEAGVRGASYRRHSGIVRPKRLAHLLLFTPDVNRAIHFYANTVGLRLSDKSEDVVAFMHGIHGSDHHLVAFAKSTHPGFHHASWDVDAVTDVGMGAMRMADEGYTRGWGLGRHVLGSNYFHYVQDPWGSFSEYSCDMDYIPATLDWTAGEHPPEDSLYLWGPDVPDIFLRNYEAPKGME